MCNRNLVALIVNLFVLSFICVNCDSLSAIQCLDRGFSSENLLCSNCHDLKQFQLNELESTCRQCCTSTNELKEDEEEKTIKYYRAVLTACTCKFPRYPQIEAFVQSDRARRFPNFSFQHVPGGDPILDLYNDRNEKVQSFGIEKWNTDTLTAFLDEVLVD